MTRIQSAPKRTTEAGGEALVLMDLGSAYLSSALALDLLPEDGRAQVALAEAPLVEGAFLAAFEAATGGDLRAVQAAAEEGQKLKKLG